MAPGACSTSSGDASARQASTSARQARTHQHQFAQLPAVATTPRHAAGLTSLAASYGPCTSGGLLAPPGSASPSFVSTYSATCQLSPGASSSGSREDGSPYVTSTRQHPGDSTLQHAGWREAGAGKRRWGRERRA